MKKEELVIRYSGTESICRVLIEGLNVDIIEKYSKLISDEISMLIGASKMSLLIAKNINKKFFTQ